MNLGSFAFRDYIIYVLPGGIVIAAFLLLSGFDLATAGSYQFLLAALFVVGGYPAGLVASSAFGAISTYTKYRKVRPDPLAGSADEVATKLLGEEIANLFMISLRSVYGAKYADRARSPAAIYLLTGFIAERSPALYGIVNRIYAIENLSRSLTVALPVLAIACIVNGLWAAVVILLIGTVLSFRKIDLTRKWLGRSVIRSFITITIDASVG